MAEEAFALSPISARASLPSEADYEAIREAFMETARGRWFLAEYTKRNRNADTNLVLDAVSRMEASLAAQKRASAALSLIEALGAIRSAIRDAKVRAAEAMPRIDGNETLAAARNGARIIREIAWTLRECGADTRICDLLDTHIKAVETAQQMIATGDSRGTVLATFDVLVQRIEQFAADETKPAAARAAPATAVPEQTADVAAEKREASVTPLFKPTPEPAEEAKTAAALEATEAFNAAQEIPDAKAAAEIAGSTAAQVQAEEASDKIATALAEILLGTPDETATAEAETVALDPETIEDLAVLDMVAMEMGAPDLSEPEIAHSDAAAAGSAAMEFAPRVESERVATAIAEPEVAAAPQPRVEAVPASSLGEALIAHGLVANPAVPASDPLAAIRRMTQIEKIAFFS